MKNLLRNTSQLLLLLFLVFRTGFLHAQLLSETFDLVRENNYFHGTTPFQEELKSNPNGLLKEVLPYLNDSNALARAFAIDLIHETGRSNPEKKLRQNVVENLVFSCKDNDAANAGKASRYLQQYNREDFSATSKDSITAYIETSPFYKGNMALLAGYLNIGNATPTLKRMLQNPSVGDKDKWDCRLALSRMGDKQETNTCINVCRSKHANNTVIHSLVPGLVYTRQKEAFDFLVTIIESDEKNCISSNPDNFSQLPCGYRVMEYIAPMVKGFPISTYNDIRQLKTDNYKAALKTVRKWFKENPDYELIDNSF
jgi:hypothetical protein